MSIESKTAIPTLTGDESAKAKAIVELFRELRDVFKSMDSKEDWDVGFSTRGDIIGEGKFELRVDFVREGK